MSRQRRIVAGWGGLAVAGSILAGAAVMVWLAAAQVHDWMAAEDMGWMGDDDE